MAGKNTRNPLLTGAGISFPFENFTNSALLVPVSQDEPPLIPEEIEAESFLGQDPPSGPKDIKSLLSSVSNKPPSSQPPTQSTPQTLGQPPPTPSPGPIPVFTQSVTSSASPARPTPLYPDTPPLHSQFTDLSLHSTTDGVNSQTYPPQTSPLLFTNQLPPTTSATTIFTPVPQQLQSNPNIFNSVSQQSHYTSTTLNSVNPQNYATPSIITPALTQPQSVPSILSSAAPAQSTTFFNPSAPQSHSTPSIFTPAPPQSQSTTTLFTPSAPQSQSTPNFFTTASPQLQSTPTFFTPQSQPTSSFFTPTPPQSQSTTTFFTSPLSQSQYTPTLFTPTPPQTQSTTIFTPAPPQVLDKPSLNYFSPPASTPSSTSPVVGNATNPPPTAAIPPVNQHPPLSNAPTASGGAVNSYRLSNIKRPTYSRPPDLAVAPMPTMPSPLPTVPTAQPPAALFTPCEPPPASAPVQVTTPTPTTTDYWSHAPPQPAPQPAIPVLAPSFASLAQGTAYRPVYHHWFHKQQVEGKTLWQPFSMTDSLALDQAFTSPLISAETKVATDGGRYDVEVLRRRRSAVYWPEEPTEVRRCSWFVKGSMDVRYVPFEENVATMLEEEYRIASTSGEWNRHVQLPDGEAIVIHSPNAIAHHTRSASPDVWGNSPQMQQKPRVVKRGLDEFDIAEGEGEQVDHLLFLVHGIGKFCDLKFRPVAEVVDDFRQVSHQLVQSHFREAVDQGHVGRVEMLPVSWHDALHEAHIDARLRDITLTSIPRLRHFTNDTLLDILFYTSPVFCETIMQAVGNELNRLYNLFLSRNPSFTGGVSLGGHSLGSLILFDMLCNQAPPAPPTPSPQPQVGYNLFMSRNPLFTGGVSLGGHSLGSLIRFDMLCNQAPPAPPTPSPQPQEDEASSASSSTKGQEQDGGEEGVTSEQEEVRALGCVRTQKARLSRTVSYVTIGTAGTGQPFIRYPQLVFHPKAFFALGSPIGMFVTVRGIESLGEDFTLPTCPMFFNIFHPFDPVAYRIEALINSDFAKYSPVLIPHHKGRKRMHLELKDTLEHVGTALKQRLVESVKSTWNTVYQLTMFNRPYGTPSSMEHEVTKVIESELLQPGGPSDADATGQGQAQAAPDLVMGRLNGGRRVDYVLQEAPLESFNEYLFALSSHVCYWESEDTMLMMLKEIYGTMGISPDTQVVQQLLPFEVPEPSGSSFPQYRALPTEPQVIGMDPTAPVSDHCDLAPPPTSGFIRK